MTQIHMTEDEIQAAKPWYKQPWLLFILTPIFAVVFYGFGFLYLSIVTMDGVVKDDYYRIARGYELNTEKNQNAIDQNIVAELKLDDVTGDIMVKLNGQLTNVPELLTLDIVHPTHQKYDQEITLKAIGSQQLYSGSLANPLKGKRYLFLFPADENWHLRKEILPPYEQRSFELKPNL
ncbi:FixH family protein [Neptunomonas japonica]|nr:FixH family protein [Neptunomonas japonica]